MPAPDVAALLTALERSDPDAAEAARVAVEWLTGGEALETVAQLDVCEFLWYTLPVKISGGEAEHARIARALGRLLRLGAEGDKERQAEEAGRTLNAVAELFPTRS